MKIYSQLDYMPNKGIYQKIYSKMFSFNTSNFPIATIDHFTKLYKCMFAVNYIYFCMIVVINTQYSCIIYMYMFNKYMKHSVCCVMPWFGHYLTKGHHVLVDRCVGGVGVSTYITTDGQQNTDNIVHILLVYVIKFYYSDQIQD